MKIGIWIDFPRRNGAVREPLKIGLKKTLTIHSLIKVIREQHKLESTSSFQVYHGTQLLKTNTTLGSLQKDPKAKNEWIRLRCTEIESFGAN